MDKTAPAVKSIIAGRAPASAISTDQKACANCVHVHMRPDLAYECWKAPPTAVAAWVQDRSGSMNLQVGGARPPIDRDAWCGDFSRKIDA